MSISVKDITVSIGAARSERFNIQISGANFSLCNFSMTERMLDHCRLSFDMTKAPEETIGDTRFQVCADIIGKEVELFLATDSIENNLKGFVSLDQNADVKFKGFVKNASAYRNSGAQYVIRVDCLSWDGILEDNPDNYSWLDRKLNDIVSEDIADIYDKVDAIIDSAFDDEAELYNYCVKWNETTWGFLQRLAVRHGEWLFNDGEHLYFGKLPEKESVKLSYPSRDIVSYGVNLETKHLKFSHVGAADYNGFSRIDGDRYRDIAYCEEASNKLGDSFNALNDAAFDASMENYKKLTMESVVGSGMRWEINGAPSHLYQQQVPQAHGRKSSLLTYQGRTACSRLSVGSKLVVNDNYITDASSNTKSDVIQDEILITFVVHTFSNDETYENTFEGLSSNTKYPPYTNPKAVPIAQPTRAIVVDNADPESMGRVRVCFAPQKEYAELAGTDSWDYVTPWIRVEQRYAFMGGIGMYIIPEKYSEVMIDFEGGNAELPYVRSCLYNGNQKLWPGYAGKDDIFSQQELGGVPDPKWSTRKDYVNEVKAIRTHSGHTIEIHDDHEEGYIGNKGYIRIYSHWKPHYELLLSADRNLIKLKSVGNIELEAGNSIIMHAKKDILMNADNNIEMNAKENIEEKAKNEMKMSSVKDMSISTNTNMNVVVNKNMTTTVGSNATDSIKGRYVQTNLCMEVKCDGHMELKTGSNILMNAKGGCHIETGNDIQLKASKEMFAGCSTFYVNATDTMIFGKTSLTLKSPMTKEC